MQLVLGILLFTILTFLFSTIWVYNVFFTFGVVVLRDLMVIGVIWWFFIFFRYFPCGRVWLRYRYPNLFPCDIVIRRLDYDVDLLLEHCDCSIVYSPQDCGGGKSSNEVEVSIARVESINASYVSIIKSSFFSDLDDISKMVFPKIGLWSKKLIVGNDMDDPTFMTMIPMILTQLISCNKSKK